MVKLKKLGAEDFISNFDSFLFSGTHEISSFRVYNTFFDFCDQDFHVIACNYNGKQHFPTSCCIIPKIKSNQKFVALCYVPNVGIELRRAYMSIVPR